MNCFNKKEIMPRCEAQLYYLVISQYTFLIDGTFVLYRQMYVGKFYSPNQELFYFQDLVSSNLIGRVKVT